MEIQWDRDNLNKQLSLYARLPLVSFDLCAYKKPKITITELSKITKLYKQEGQHSSLAFFCNPQTTPSHNWRKTYSSVLFVPSLYYLLSKLSLHCPRPIKIHTECICELCFCSPERKERLKIIPLVFLRWNLLQVNEFRVVYTDLSWVNTVAFLYFAF